MNNLRAFPNGTYFLCRCSFVLKCDWRGEWITDGSHDGSRLISLVRSMIGSLTKKNRLFHLQLQMGGVGGCMLSFVLL